MVLYWGRGAVGGVGEGCVVGGIRWILSDVRFRSAVGDVCWHLGCKGCAARVIGMVALDMVSTQRSRMTSRSVIHRNAGQVFGGVQCWMFRIL